MGGDPAGGQLGHRVGPLDVQPLAADDRNIFTAMYKYFYLMHAQNVVPPLARVALPVPLRTMNG